MLSPVLCQHKEAFWMSGPSLRPLSALISNSCLLQHLTVLSTTVGKADIRCPWAEIHLRWLTLWLSCINKYVMGEWLLTVVCWEARMPMVLYMNEVFFIVFDLKPVIALVPWSSSCSPPCPSELWDVTSGSKRKHSRSLLCTPTILT